MGRMQCFAPMLFCILLSIHVHALTIKGEDYSGKLFDVGFEEGSKVLSVGLMQGSLAGVSVEWGLSYLLGFHLGLGAVGADAGANLHVASDMKKDLYFSALAVYLPTFDNLVMPSVAFGMRWYFGPRYQVGLCTELGFMLATKGGDWDIQDRDLILKKNSVLPRVGLGLAFKLR